MDEGLFVFGKTNVSLCPLSTLLLFLVFTIMNKMKVFITALAFVAAGLQVAAQSKEIRSALTTAPRLDVLEQPVAFRTASESAFSIFFMADEDDVQKHFKNWVKTVSGSDLKKEGSFLATYKMVIPAWSLDSLQLFMKSEKDGLGSRFFLLVSTPKGFLTTPLDATLGSTVKTELIAQSKVFYTRYYDSAIGDAQKEFDTQQKDVERLVKKQSKLNSEIEDHNNDLKKADENSRGLTEKLATTEAKMRDNKSKLDQQKSREEQAQKEIDINTTSLRIKQSEYDAFNRTGDLNTKQAVKVSKELEKLRKAETKLKEKQAKEKAATTKLENQQLDLERSKSDMNAKIDANKVAVDSHFREIDSLKRDLDGVARSLNDERLQANQAQQVLDQLKLAKTALLGVN